MKNNKKSKQSGIRIVIYALIIVALTFVAIVTAAEIYFRATGRFGPTPYRKSSIPGLLFEMRPNHAYDSYHGIAHMNSEGFRDREHRVDRTKDVKRIVCLGDSMTVGVEMPPEKVYVKQLEMRLNRRGVRVETMNMAVGGYNTAQEWLVYEHKAKKYKPDLVTVQFTLNDLTYIYPFYVGERLSGRLKVFLGEHLNTYRFLSYMKRRWNGDVNIDQSKGLGAADAAGMPVGLDFMEPVYDPNGKYFRDWKAAAAQFGELNRSGTPVLFIIHPWPIYTAMEKGAPYPYYSLHRQIGRALREQGIPYIDVTPALTSRGTLHSFWSAPADFHLNAAAHAIIADAIRPEVERILTTKH